MTVIFTISDNGTKVATTNTKWKSLNIDGFEPNKLYSMLSGLARIVNENGDAILFEVE